MTRRQGNRPDRRIAPAGAYSPDALAALAKRIRYIGEGHHKLRPGDYGFRPPANPRPTKSVCDDLRPVLLEEATELFRTGIETGLVSTFGENGIPKYIWSVDDTHQVYEAKVSKSAPLTYHGYRLGDDDGMRQLILKAWGQRCRQR